MNCEVALASTQSMGSELILLRPGVSIVVISGSSISWRNKAAAARVVIDAESSQVNLSLLLCDANYWS